MTELTNDLLNQIANEIADDVNELNELANNNQLTDELLNEIVTNKPTDNTLPPGVDTLTNFADDWVKEVLEESSIELKTDYAASKIKGFGLVDICSNVANIEHFTGYEYGKIFYVKDKKDPIGFFAWNGKYFALIDENEIKHRITRVIAKCKYEREDKKGNKVELPLFKLNEHDNAMKRVIGAITKDFNHFDKVRCITFNSCCLILDHKGYRYEPHDPKYLSTVYIDSDPLPYITDENLIAEIKELIPHIGETLEGVNRNNFFVSHAVALHKDVYRLRLQGQSQYPNGKSIDRTVPGIFGVGIGTNNKSLPPSLIAKTYPIHRVSTTTYTELFNEEKFTKRKYKLAELIGKLFCCGHENDLDACPIDYSSTVNQLITPDGGIVADKKGIRGILPEEVDLIFMQFGNQMPKIASFDKPFNLRRLLIIFYTKSYQPSHLYNPNNPKHLKQDSSYAEVPEKKLKVYFPALLERLLETYDQIIKGEVDYDFSESVAYMQNSGLESSHHREWYIEDTVEEEGSYLLFEDYWQHYARRAIRESLAVSGKTEYLKDTEANKIVNGGKIISIIPVDPEYQRSRYPRDKIATSSPMLAKTLGKAFDGFTTVSKPGTTGRDARVKYIPNRRFKTEEEKNSNC